MANDDEEVDGGGEDAAPGWDAIDEALRPVYGTQEPTHWGTVIPWALGGPDPIRGISAYRSGRGRPHLHYVTYGFSELYEKESDDPDVSGFGFELTFRLARAQSAPPPNFVLGLLQNLGRYVFETGRRFGVGHSMPLNSPIELDSARGALTSFQKHNVVALRSGYGFNYGLFYGGTP